MEFYDSISNNAVYASEEKSFVFPENFYEAIDMNPNKITPPLSSQSSTQSQSA